MPQHFTNRMSFLPLLLLALTSHLCCALNRRLPRTYPARNTAYLSRPSIEASESTIDRLAIVEDLAKLTIESLGNSLSHIKESDFSSALKLKCHPGFSFSLGCNFWRSSFYEGSVDGWSAHPLISWLSMSKMKLVDIEAAIAEKRQKVSLGSFADGIPLSTVQVLAWHSTDFDVPHIRMICSLDGDYRNLTDRSIRLFMDYSPRVDLISNLDYFDKYYKGIDEDHFKILESKSHLFTFRNQHFNTIQRLSSSPMALNLEIPYTNEGIQLATDLWKSHINRYCHWLTKGVISRSDDHLKQLLISRDQSAHRLIFDELKFSAAEVMGSDFAPKATEISASMLGPISNSYLVSSPKQ